MTFKLTITLIILAQLASTSSACGLALEGAAAPEATEAGRQQAETKTISGTVVGVSDGDTITVLDQTKTRHRVRLKGIDAPESGQDFGQASKQNLSDLIFQKVVQISYEKTDRYDRILGVVRCDRTDINLAQVEAGYAWHYKEYQDEQTPAERAAYSAAESRARSARKGLWQQPNPVKPSDFRRSKRQE